MTSDDVIAYLAKLPRRTRPTELQTDAEMLRAWLNCRDMEDFRDDVICRHGLMLLKVEDLQPHTNSIHEHAITNAWGWLVESIL